MIVAPVNPRGDVAVESFDPNQADAVDLAGYYGVVRASHLVDEPDEPEPTYEDVVERLRNPFPGVSPAAHWVVRGATGIVAFGYARFPEEENSHIAVATVVVHPGYRRQGIGTRLLTVMLPHFRERGRTVIEDWRLPEGGTAANWAHGLGFKTVRAPAVQALAVAGSDRARWPVAWSTTGLTTVRTELVVAHDVETLIARLAGRRLSARSAGSRP